ncbi:MAG: hypothetical protein L0Z50_27870 [Verrucomicrobiales bacterium]|nr:hypothetical protein [Verrucomicrobiales bacterium]
MRFENDPLLATAPAQTVRISVPLHGDFDFRSFRLGDFGFGTNVIRVTNNIAFLQRRIDLAASRGVYLDLIAGVDVRTGEAYWQFRAIDPATGDAPANPLIGFLPPNLLSPEGEGFVTFSIMPKSSIPTGTRIHADARIIFNQNEPVDTAPFWNTLDAVAPASAVTNLPNVVLANFPVAWSGSDDANGSGLQSFDIYVSDNGGRFQLWLSATALTNVIYSGVVGHTYRFYSRVRDNAGNTESPPTEPDAVTTVIVSPPAFHPIPTNRFVVRVNEGFGMTNSASGGGGADLVYELVDGPTGATLRALDSRRSKFAWAPSCDQGSTTNHITLRVSVAGTPRASSTLSFTIVVPDCVETSIGQTAVAAGESACVPLLLLSTVELTNLTFIARFAPDRLTDFSVRVDPQFASTPQWKESTAGELNVSLTLPADRIIRGSAEIGGICFGAIANRPSAFIPLEILDVDGRKPNGDRVANAFGLAGRVVVVADRPLLEATLNTNSQPILIIYALVPSTNVIQYVTNITDTNWQDGWEIIQTNLVETFSVIGTNAPTTYLRAKQK